MSLKFEELGYQQTPLGEISLRRRSEPKLDGEILYEVKLGEEFLMSSLFTEAEIQLAKLGLAQISGTHLDIVVGGLGLGYTAAAVLDDPRVNTLTVVEIMEPIIDWHKRQLVPLGKELTSDQRCTLLHADFFELAAQTNQGFNLNDPHQFAHAILLDIDHSPSHWLNSSNSGFYSKQSLEKLATKIHPSGIFGLWSNDPPDAQFTQLLESVFESSQAHVVNFPNPYTDRESSNTVYLAKKTSTE